MKRTHFALVCLLIAAASCPAQNAPQPATSDANQSVPSWAGPTKRRLLSETNLPGDFQPRAACRRAPFPDYREQHRSGEEGKHQSARAHSVDIMTQDAQSGNRAFAPLGSSSRLSSSNQAMPPRSEATIRKATEPDLEVGSICADRDGNRIRIDRIDVAHGAETVSYHFLNDELRVQEGIQERPLEQFLAEGWYIAAQGRFL